MLFLDIKINSKKTLIFYFSDYYLIYKSLILSKIKTVNAKIGLVD